VGRDGEVLGVIWGNREVEYFCEEDSTETKRDLPVGQHKGLGYAGRPQSCYADVLLLAALRGDRPYSEPMEAVMRKYRDLENLPSFQHHA
jgi:hypothetical protein